MGEKMTLEQVREWHLEKAMEYVRMQNRFPNDSTVLTSLEKMHQDMADALATPAQTVDVEKVLSVIPSNWCDPLLSGKNAVIGMPPYSCTDVERLLLALKNKLSQAIGDKT